MIQIITKPLRVYIILGALAFWGILSGLNLPISLFPNSSQITVVAFIPTGSLSSQQFFEVYGRETESLLQGIKVNSVPVKQLYSEYRNQQTKYQLVFDWGAEPEKAISEIRNVINSQFASAGEDIKRGISVNSWSENRGFFAVSFYSPLRSLDDLYLALEPLITPLQSEIDDAGDFGLWNPNQKEVSVKLIPEKLAQFEISSAQVHRYLQTAVIGLTGGTLKLGEKDYLIDLPKSVETISELSQVRVSQRQQQPIFLKDVAIITVGVSKEGRQKFKTSGVDSLILFSSPKEGGNIKKMSDQILNKLTILEKQWPKDVQFKILVNPSEFINNSIHSVIHEVLMAALLAVIVLFLFIGNFKNVITAAIEIPLSLLMAFIMMKIAGMNLNLISLGGLALSAGMNVDASVVVLENIIRHFETKKNQILSYEEKISTLLEAVKEVQLPIIASTIASLVVFFPLILTQGLTHSLLGDLAKAVIFSHGLSALVALILVPTIRLQLIKKGISLESHSPIEKHLSRLENYYAYLLENFLNHKKIHRLAMLFLIIILPLLIMTVLPKLEKEVIGKPDSDWLIIGLSSPTFSNIKQLESELESLEASIQNHFTDEVLYTFTQMNGANNGNIMVRIKHKDKIQSLIEKAEDTYKNTSTKFYWVDYWNPSELSIPNPPDYRLEIVGGDSVKRVQLAQDIQNLLIEKGVFDKVRVNPTADKEKEIKVEPHFNAGAESEILSKEEMSHYLRVITSGVYAEKIYEKQQSLPIYLRLNQENISSLDQLKAIPVGFEGRLIPLSALADIRIQDRAPRIYREDQKSLIVLTATVNKSQKSLTKEKIKLAQSVIDNFKSSHPRNSPDEPNIVEVKADKELTESLDQLKWAVALSILLVFITMVLQLGDFVHSLLVLVAIPLGFIGVLVSLFLFKSTLSLNSGLGTILLNGIAVANSIILVDFIKKLHASGLDAHQATLQAAKARLRPILMTSLTTVLGMLPIALGLGEGGKILQPLGIAVCGGLWISMLLTLFIVPTLQYLYLTYRDKNEN